MIIGGRIASLAVRAQARHARRMAAKYEVLVNARDDDSYMYSNTSYTYYVVSTDTGDELDQFSGSDDETAKGRSRKGVASVVIDGGQMVAKHYSGKLERRPLPTKIKIVDRGKQIELTWADGRVERRERNEALGFTARGQVFSMKPLVKPPK
jgi:hypothetical protein